MRLRPYQLWLHSPTARQGAAPSGDAGGPRALRAQCIHHWKPETWAFHSSHNVAGLGALAVGACCHNLRALHAKGSDTLVSNHASGEL